MKKGVEKEVVCVICHMFVWCVFVGARFISWSGAF